MADQTDSTNVAVPFQNHGLFSDHFLKARLPERKEWQLGAELIDFRAKLQSLYQSKKSFLPNLNEAQTEKEFIQPLLDLLGYGDSYAVQVPTKQGQQTGRPDYALFPDEKTKNQAYAKLNENDYTQCIGIADAKYWERELDLAKSTKRDTFTNQNPSFQIAAYLTGTKQRWGILTNGRCWRLYSSSSHQPLGNYFQVDLVELLSAPDEDLKYFYLFFRREALLQVDSKSFLDRVFDGSEEYAVELEADIKARAYDVVERLCRGFAANFTAEELTESVLKHVYDNSLTVLYRLLFVFYAEARELLPLTASTSYRNNYSMRKVTSDIDELLKNGEQPSSHSKKTYQYIGGLFDLINSGDSVLGIPEYNGGLFNPEEHPFLQTHGIADAFLIHAIHHLARVTDRKLKREVAVDYNTLSERHLGSIYEGLLEFKLQLTKGELYLANDKGERKASGSFYTPQYIVDYIVKNTLDPVVEEAQAKVKALKPDVDKEITRLEKLRDQKQGLEPTEKYDRAIAKEKARLLQPYLSLKVLDPAMGSGHFLSRATDSIAEVIAKDPYIERNLELTEESELTYYRRRVVENCIYGVDLNPLAVELAKLTLWLTTMAKSKPLSFLNHHLRVGNSLIGARVDDLDEIPKPKKKRGKSLDLSRAPVQLGLFQERLNKKLNTLLQSRALIAQLPTETLENIHDKEKWEAGFQHDIERFRTLADLWTSTHFGNEVAWDRYNTLVENLQADDPTWEGLTAKRLVNNALKLRDKHRFFHWELEFPEVFYDERGNRKPTGGFDAVVGNPPYVDSEQMTKSHPELREYCVTRWMSASGNWDLFVVFVELGITLARQQGYSSLIVPNKLLGAEYSVPIQAILSANRLLSLRDYSRIKVFGADVYPVVYLVKKAKALGPDEIEVSVAIEESEQGQPKIVCKDKITTKVLTSLPEGYWWSVFSNDFGVTAKAIDVSESFAKCATISGAASVSEAYKLADLIVPLDKYAADEEFFMFVNTGTIDRYASNWATDSTQYGATYLRPVISKNLLQHELPRRWEQAQTKKLILAGMVTKLEAMYDSDGAILAGKSTVIVLESSLSLSYILSLLNSRLLTFVFRQVFGSLALSGGYLVVGPPQVEKIPIRKVCFNTPTTEREQLLSRGQRAYRMCLGSDDSQELDALIAGCLPKDLDGSPDTEHEKSDVVHDLLAVLAEEMTRLNKEKQAAIRAFLTWLEKEILKGSVEDQRNKTKIRNFHEATFEDLLDTLKKNKVLPDPCPSQTRATVLAEFTTATNILTPLKARIAATDKLVDQVVYRLYGLTDEEIAIVEGPPIGV